MDESPSKPRIESSKKQQSSSGSRAAKVKTLSVEIWKLLDEFTRLGDEFDDCERMLVSVIKRRESLTNKMYLLVNTLESTVARYEYTENACNELDEKHYAISLELRDPNLDAEREQMLQELVESLTEVQEDLGKTKRGIELSYNECLRFESELNLLTIANETVHKKLCEKLAKIDRSRRETLEKWNELLDKKKVFERKE